MVCRHGKALDLHKDYLSSPAKKGKENAEPHAKHKKAHGNWPEVEIRVASKHSGDLLQLSIADLDPAVQSVLHPSHLILLYVCNCMHVKMIQQL